MSNKVITINSNTRLRGILATFAAFAVCLVALTVGVIPPAPAAHASPDVATWTRQFTGGSSNEVRQFSRTDADHLWASGSYGRVMRTTDGGQNWSTTLMPDPGMLMHSVKFVDNQVGWTGGEWHGGGVLFRSTDGGVTWQQQQEPSGQRIMGVWAIDRQTVMVVGGGTYFAITRRSTDGGVTWTDMPVPLNDSMFLDIFFLDANTGWITGLNGGIAKTTDGGVTWQAQNRPANWGLESINFSDANNGWAGGYYGVLMHTTNGGTTWVSQNPVLPDYTHVLGVSAVSPSVAWIAGYGGGAQSRPFVKKTTDGGNTWVNYTPAVGPYDGFGPVMFLGADNGWAGGYAGIFRRSDGSIPPTATPTQAATNTPVATFTPISTNTPAPARLSGHVTWQGRAAQPNVLQQLPVTLTLKLGTTEVNYSTMTTDANGNFTMTLGSLPNGTYSWRVKGPKYLANVGQVTLTGAAAIQVEMGLMRAGDANNDNVVNSQDLNILRNTYGRQLGDPGYDDRADFNGDQVVNSVDQNLLKNNFGAGGAPPIIPVGSGS